MKISSNTQHFIVISTLIAIYLFGAFLRMEDYPAWQSMPEVYQQDGEFKMANFDSYYYLIAAKDLMTDNYDSLDEQRHLPRGKNRPSIPPLSSSLAAIIAKISGLPIDRIAIVMPVIFAPLLAFVVYGMARGLNLYRRYALLAGLLAIVSYTYVVRSRIGVFDTDCLNVVWVCLNAWLASRALNSNHRLNAIALGALIISTLLFALWWNTAVFVAVLSGLMPLTIIMCQQWLKHRKAFKQKHQPLLIILSSLWLLTFASFHQQMFTYLNFLLGLNHSVFPLLGDVTELTAASPLRFINDTTGSFLLMLLALIGLVGLAAKNGVRLWVYGMPIGLCFAPLVAGNRFMIFSAPILALGAAYSLQQLSQFKPYQLAVTDKAKQLNGLLIIAMTMIGVEANYERLTLKLTKPAVEDHRIAMQGLKGSLSKTDEPEAAIWTSWPLGYQVHYYLNRATFADGEFDDGGETLFYLYLPLASDNLTFSANFMKFYATQDIRSLYPLFESPIDAIELLQQVLQHPPEHSKRILARGLRKGEIPTSDTLTNAEDWLRFLYPQTPRPLYLFLHERMIRTVFWFKQGNLDLRTGETIGLPFYLWFHDLKAQGPILQNDEVMINTTLGVAQHNSGTTHSFAHIGACQNGQCQQTDYKMPPAMRPQYQDSERFVFEWHPQRGYGAAMSNEIARSTFNRLFLREETTPYFELLEANTPQYQLWRIRGNVYP